MFSGGRDLNSLRRVAEDRVNDHLSSRTIPIQGHDETTTDTEHEEVYGGERYSSLDSPPQEDNVSTNISVLRKYGAAERYSIGKTCGMAYTDDDSDDTSSEYSSTQPVNNDPLYRVRTYESNGYYGSSSCGNSAAEKVTCTRNLHYEKLYDDHDDAPFFDSTKEIKQNTDPREQVLTSRVNSHIINTHETVTGSLQFPTFHASSQGPWLSVIAYDACVRLCLRAWAEQCMEAPIFLESECALLRNSFGLQNILLKPEEELLEKHSSIQSNEIAVTKPRKMVGKMKVQVIKVKTAMDPPTGFNLSSLSSKKIKLYTTVVQYRLSNIHVRLSSGWRAVGRIRFTRERIPLNRSFSRKNMATYVRASARYVKQVSRLVKVGVKTLRSNSSSRDEGVPVPEATTYTCSLRLKSSSEEEAVRLNPGSGETHVFFPDSLGDNLIVEINDSKGNKTGRVVAQIAEVAEDPGEKLRWWTIYREPEHELVGKLQLYINYSTTLDENNLKFGNIAETVAYDLVLEVAMKVQKFQRRNLSLHGPWKWLLIEFSTYYGVSDAYTKLRYLSYIMEVATPTADCLTLVYDLLFPVIMKRGDDIKRTLSHQENRILGDVEEQINQILGLVFENYKCLDENSQSGMKEVFIPSTGIAAPALEPAVKLFTLLHDIYSPESQTKLYTYFQVAAKKRARRNLTETDEFVTGNNDAVLMDPVTNSTAYKKMKSLCLNFRNEIFTDMEIHNQHVLPDFIDLPNLSSAIYCVELSNRLRRFLIVCPPIGPTPHVTELVIATADLQKDLCNWNINPIKGGVDAKELFHFYIMLWIQDKRLSLLDSCKLDKIKWPGVRTQHSTTPFIDEIYNRLMETLNDYEVIISRWPDYTTVLENAIADIEKVTMETLEKQYADVLLPIKENFAPKKFGLKYVHKLTKRSTLQYVVPDELGVLLNSLKRILDCLQPKIEKKFNTWGAESVDCLSEVTIMIRSKFRNYIQSVVEKLVENTKLHNVTKLKKILGDSIECVSESEVENRMQPLKDQLTDTIEHLHGILATRVFVLVCRGYWDRMGQEFLTFLENRKDNRSWYKGSNYVVEILDCTFASQMQQLLGNVVQESDIEPPKTVMEVRSIIWEDVSRKKGNSFYY